MNSQLKDCKDERLRTDLIPTYAPGCKRVAFSSDWIPMMLRDNVNLETKSLCEIDASGAIFKDFKTGEETRVDCDIIVSFVFKSLFEY